MKKVVMIVWNYAVPKPEMVSSNVKGTLSQIRSISISMPEAAQVIIVPFVGAQISSWRFLEPSLKSVIHQQRWTNPALVNCPRACHSNSSGDFRRCLGSRITIHFFEFQFHDVPRRKNRTSVVSKEFCRQIFERLIRFFRISRMPSKC